MVIIKNILFIFLVIQLSFSFAQNTSKKQKDKSNSKAVKKSIPLSNITKQDCKDAVKLSLKASTTYGPTLAPEGFGNIQEITKGNNLIFEEEHNSAWYSLTIEKGGELIFDIIPNDTSNDYDFILFEIKDSNFCESFVKNEMNPVRSNLSNIIKTKKGRTGIKEELVSKYVKKGVGNSHSSSIMVKSGERYMLILDNVTPKGKGHKLVFDMLRNVVIQGVVLNSDSIPIVSEIGLYDDNGSLLVKTRSNKKGSYNIQKSIKENRNYNLQYFSDSTFPQIKVINTRTLKETNVFSDIKIILPKLKKGKKYKLGSINFYGNSDELLPNSNPSVEALAMLMKRNKKMIILIEGHTNGEDWHLAPEYQDKREKILSEDRAKKICDYLISRDIDKSRFSSIGLSSTLPVYPSPKSEAEQSANRRVEIKVISIRGE